MTGIFGHGDLRLYLLSLLAEHPRHGYELIQALSDRFGGTYSPSAGTIYPRLAKLEDEGLVTKTTDGRKTVYSITDAGRAELDARQDDLDSIENNVTDSVRQLADSLRAGVNEAMRSLRADLAAAARSSRPDPNRSYTDAATPNYGFPAAADGADATSATGETAADGDASAPGEGFAPDETAASGARANEPNYGRTPQSSAAEDQRRLNSDAIRDAEAAVNSFRSSVRVELRKHAARAAVPQAAVTHLTSELKRLQAELKAALSA